MLVLADHEKYGQTDVQQDISMAESTLVDLNDDCLLEIFRMLSPDDLLSINDTCSRFRTLTVPAVTLKYGDTTINLNTWYIDEHSKFNILQIRHILRKFGSLIAGVECFRSEANNNEIRQILNLILANCNGALRTLNLSHFHIDADIIDRLPPICDNLESLRLDRCTLHRPNSPSLPKWTKMLNLDISFENLENDLFDAFHPQLQRLVLGGAIKNLNQVDRFLRRQYNLKKISISFP